jgi:hypothetical protein
MAASTKTVDETIIFLLQVIESCSGFKADYHVLARNAGINTPSNAYEDISNLQHDVTDLRRQRRLKSLAESAGFMLVNGSVVRASDNAVPAPKPRKRKALNDGAAASASKKAKMEGSDGKAVNADEGAGEA